MPEAGESSRIFTLDVIRGVAVMGILAMNIVGFAMPEQAYVNPTAFGTYSRADWLSWLVSFLFIDGRMRGLFSFLFGASMLLIIERTDAAGDNSARVHFARMAWLLVFGLLHYYLIWWGDILTIYAVIGMIAWLFVYRSMATLLRWGTLLIFAQTAVELQQQGIDFFSADPERVRASLDLFRSGFTEIASHRIRENLLQPLINIMVFGWETLGYMLFGMAALKSGFLTGEWPRHVYLRIAVMGFAIGVPIYALLAWVQVSSGFDPTVIRIWNLTATVPVRPIMIVAVAALIILLSRRNGPLTRRVAAAGRTAFTNYLGTSLIMTSLFYGWGLGWFGTLSRAELWLVVLPMWALMLLWSKPWLDHFRYGPFEWLWRSLARGQIQPMRQRAEAPQTS